MQEPQNSNPNPTPVIASRLSLRDYEAFEKQFLITGRTDNPTQAAIQLGEQRVLQALRRQLVV